MFRDPKSKIAKRRRRSHIVIIAIIVAFTTYFLYANRRQNKGKQILEQTVSLENHLRTGFLFPLTTWSGGFQVHVLKCRYLVMGQRDTVLEGKHGHSTAECSKSIAFIHRVESLFLSHDGILGFRYYVGRKIKYVIVVNAKKDIRS